MCKIHWKKFLQVSNQGPPHIYTKTLLSLSVTVLLEYLVRAFFTGLVLLYISLVNTLTTIVTSCADRFSSYSVKRINL